MDFRQLPFISKVKENQEAFGNKVIAIADRLGIMPAWLMIVMNNESGLNHRIKNPNGSATGLIQFTEATAKALGTSTAALAAMSNVDQLDFVELYFTKFGWYKQIKDLPDTYLLVFFPKALYENDDWQFPTWAVKANPIFDINKDGKLTKAEFKQYVNNKYSKYITPEAQNEFEAKKKSKTIIIVVAAIVIIVAAFFTIKYFTGKK